MKKHHWTFFWGFLAGTFLGAYALRALSGVTGGRL
jgi:glycerol uptake facilitator-like aquaporin